MYALIDFVEVASAFVLAVTAGCAMTLRPSPGNVVSLNAYVGLL